MDSADTSVLVVAKAIKVFYMRLKREAELC